MYPSSATARDAQTIGGDVSYNDASAGSERVHAHGLATLNCLIPMSHSRHLSLVGMFVSALGFVCRNVPAQVITTGTRRPINNAGAAGSGIPPAFQLKRS